METTVQTERTIGSDVEVGKLGIWLFLASEILLFGGFLASYVMIRLGSSVCALGAPAWPQAGFTGGLLFATINTAVLITSSFTMVRAFEFAQQRVVGAFSQYLLATTLLGGAFLVIKIFEYTAKVHHGYFPGSALITATPGLGIFVSFYFALTGLHALHVLVGLLWNLSLYRRGRTPEFPEHFVRKVEYAGIYWHFVDVIWVFLFPLFYLI